MIKLDDNLLVELGLSSLPPDEKKKMLAHIYETLEMRVGMKLAEQMTDAQLDEFEQFINRNDEAGALRWLEANFPHYKDVVAQEFERLKAEIKQVAPQILASAAAQAQQAMPAAGHGQMPQQAAQPHQQYQPQQAMPPQSHQYAPQPSQQAMHQQQPYQQHPQHPTQHNVAPYPQHNPQQPQQQAPPDMPYAA